MIVDVRTHAPGLLFDANGGEILYAIWADTETGEVQQYVKDGESFRIENNEVVKVSKTYPAPLRYEPVKRRAK